MHQHNNETGHLTNHNNFQIIGSEGYNLARNIKESVFIRVNNPTLNNNICKFNLPHIWDNVLVNIPGLKLNRHVQNIGHTINTNSPLMLLILTPLLINPLAQKVLTMLTSLHTSHVALSMCTECPRTLISTVFQFSFRPDEV